jgi:peroxiredoxin
MRAAVLGVGDKVPDFTLRLAYADGRRDPVPFRELLRQGPVVLSFFPIAFSGVCTPQMCEMRDHLPDLQRLGARNVVALSTDAQHVNVAYAKANGLGFPIYSDPNREVVGKLWPATTTADVRDTAVRGWMVVDEDGTVVALWRSPDPEVWCGIAPIEAALAKLG